MSDQEIKSIHYPVLEYVISNRECDRFSSVKTPFYSLIRLNKNTLIACGGGGSLKSGVANSILAFRCGPENSYKLQRIDSVYFEKDCPCSLTRISDHRFIATTYTNIRSFTFNGSKLIEDRLIESNLKEEDADTLHSCFQLGNSIISLTSSGIIFNNVRTINIKEIPASRVTCSVQNEAKDLFIGVKSNGIFISVSSAKKVVSSHVLPEQFSEFYIHRMAFRGDTLFAVICSAKSTLLVALDKNFEECGSFDLGSQGINAISVCDDALALATDQGQIQVLNHKFNGDRVHFTKHNTIKNAFAGLIITDLSITKSGFDDFFVVASSIDGAIASYFIYHKNEDKRRLIVGVALSLAILAQFLGPKFIK